jgi:acyl-CoA reductase-like NAD-dependent aldehyde dehydrogenase
MELNESQLEDLVKRVIKKLESKDIILPPKRETELSEIPQGKLGIFNDVNSAITAAQKAFDQMDSLSLEIRSKIISNIRNITKREIKRLSFGAVKETGLGRVEDKLKKNLLAIEKTPGLEILKPTAWSGDNGLTILERAPYGVIGSITPCTNPTATIICNTIGMIAAGNAVVFNVHPAAKKISSYLISLINTAIMEAKGPENLVVGLSEPTVETAQELMKHPKIQLLVVTGGPQVVKLAMNSGKKVIAAGPGNPPVVVDETANIQKASQGIIEGASFDNNIVCVDEKEIIAVEKIADQLKRELISRGTYELKGNQISRLERILIKKEGPNKEFIGKNASLLLDLIGIKRDENLRLIFCELEKEHPFIQEEMLMPIIGLLRVKDVHEAIETAKEVEHGFRHTAVMYSTNIESLHKMARIMNTSIFVKNAPSLAGLGYKGEGYTSFTIASPTGEGLTCAVHFTRERRCILKDYFRII